MLNISMKQVDILFRISAYLLKEHELTSSVLINVANSFWETFGKKAVCIIKDFWSVYTEDFESRQYEHFRRYESFSCPIRNNITFNGLNISSCFHRLCLLGAFTKLRKGTVCFVMSVRPSVRIKQLGSH